LSRKAAPNPGAAFFSYQRSAEARFREAGTSRAPGREPSLFPLPVILGLIRYAQLPYDLGRGRPVSQPNLGLAELPDNLLRRELLTSWHLSPTLGLHHPEILSESGDFLGRYVTAEVNRAREYLEALA